MPPHRDRPLLSAHTPALYFFFFNDTATTEIYTLSLHDALPICSGSGDPRGSRSHDQEPSKPIRIGREGRRHGRAAAGPVRRLDRKSTRLNSSHANISYAVFCLKKKNTTSRHRPTPNRLLLRLSL